MKWWYTTKVLFVSFLFLSVRRGGFIGFKPKCLSDYVSMWDSLLPEQMLIIQCLGGRGAFLFLILYFSLS